MFHISLKRVGDLVPPSLHHYGDESTEFRFEGDVEHNDETYRVSFCCWSFYDWICIATMMLGFAFPPTIDFGIYNDVGICVSPDHRYNDDWICIATIIGLGLMVA
jgi:hypothetical protein